MTKTYKHKKLGWLAEENSTTYKIEDNRGFHYYIAKELIENSNDRELQEEKDWIDEAIKEYAESPDNDDWDVHKAQLRKTIEKYMPKISEKELDNIFYGYNDEDKIADNMKILLKEKGLYLDK